MPVDPLSVPDFDDLPPVKGMPQGCVWGIFDQDGRKDLVGTLNFLTPSIVKEAASEVRDGVSISLNWPLNALSKVQPQINRECRHTTICLPEALGISAKGVNTWDDQLDFNTQASSQWDSFCHYAHHPSGLAYNGFEPVKKFLSATSTELNKLPTLDHWHSRGGLVGRGILLDYKAYAEETGIPFDPLEGDRVKVHQLEACARHFGLVFRPADILIIRMGTTEALSQLASGKCPNFMEDSATGIHGCQDTASWLWNKRFAAVATDCFALEALPPLRPDGTVGGGEDLPLHQYMLSCFGMPIGELWDLARLSHYCKKTKRYSFMLTSAPLNHPCLIGSPCNALAIF